jgi:hypothetical protein
MAVISKVADAVKDELAAGTFSIPFKAIRAFRHDQTLPEGKEIRVSVVPNAVKVAPVARGLCHYDMEIYVAVSKKIDRATPETIDPRLALVEEIVDSVRLRRLANCPEAMWVSTENRPMVSTEHLENLKTFTSLVTTVWRACR